MVKPNDMKSILALFYVIMPIVFISQSWCPKWSLLCDNMGADLVDWLSWQGFGISIDVTDIPVDFIDFIVICKQYFWKETQSGFSLPIQMVF